MKKIIASLVIIFGFYLPSTFAATSARADLIELDYLGHEISSDLSKHIAFVPLTNRVEGRDLILFKEQINPSSNQTPEVKISQFEVKKIESLGCGSFKYTATETPDSDFQNIKMRPLKTLEVIDHTQRVCEDYKKYLWEVRMTVPVSRGSYIRFFAGNPASSSASTEARN
jgi:hypothetical protein